LLQPINNARTLSGAGFQDLDIWLSGPGFQDLNARFQDLDLRTWVSGPQREVSGPGSQDLGFRPSVFGSQDLGFRTSKALHPTVVLSFLCVHRHFSFSRHFSLRPPSLFSGHRQTHGLRLEISGTNCSSGSGYHAKSDGSDRRTDSAWRFPERTAVAVPVLVRLPRKEWRVGRTDALREFIYKIDLGSLGLCPCNIHVFLSLQTFFLLYTKI
jgi:hypothetical protein